MWEEVDDMRIYSERAERTFVGISVSESTESHSSSALKAVPYSKQKDSFLFSINIHNPFEMNSAFRLHPRLNLKPTCLEKNKNKVTWHVITWLYIHFSHIFPSHLFCWKPLSKPYVRVTWHFMGFVTKWDAWDLDQVALTGDHWASVNIIFYIKLLLCHDTFLTTFFWQKWQFHNTNPIKFTSTCSLVFEIFQDSLLRMTASWVGITAGLRGRKLFHLPLSPMTFCHAAAVWARPWNKGISKAAFSNATSSNTWSAGTPFFVFLTCGQNAHKSGLL